MIRRSFLKKIVCMFCGLFSIKTLSSTLNLDNNKDKAVVDYNFSKKGITLIGSVAELRACEAINNEKIVFLLGYYEDDSCGQGFLIRDYEVSRDDSGHFFMTAAGCCWRRIKENENHYFPSEFGGRENSNSTQAINNMLLAVYEKSLKLKKNINCDTEQSGIVIDFSGSWGISSQIRIPPLSSVVFQNGKIYCLDDFTDLSMICFLSEVNDKIAYEGCRWNGITLDARKKAACMILNDYNRFYISGGAIFKGFKGVGLYLGDMSGMGKSFGHECLTDGMYFYEYDYWDTLRGLEDSVAIYISTNDNHLTNWVVGSSAKALIIAAPGNRLSHFHVWGCIDKNESLLLKSGLHTGTSLSDFKLGTSRLVIENPFGVQIINWLGEHKGKTFNYEYDYIWLKPIGKNVSVRSVTIQGGNIQVIDGGDHKCRTVSAEGQMKGAISSITIINRGGGYTRDDIRISVVGDGEGAILEPIIVNSRLSCLRVVNGGGNYTYAKVLIQGEGSGAVTEVNLADESFFDKNKISNIYIGKNYIVGTSQKAMPQTKYTCKIFDLDGFSRLNIKDIMIFPENTDIVSCRALGRDAEVLPLTVSLYNNKGSISVKNPYEDSQMKNNVDSNEILKKFNSAIIIFQCSYDL
ncbi:hypothetical protein [Serratia fonticola]|uniref:hypothetical protein n=1 Tax=Serratia fonticola TaxID=47917 RepID=UPI003AAACC00